MKENVIQNKTYIFALSIFNIYRQLKQQHEYSLADQTSQHLPLNVR